MMKSKKLVTFLLMLSLVASLTGCSAKSQDTVVDSQTSEEVTGTPETSEETLDSNETEEAAVYSADVIVVGAGGAGMTAAIEAANAGASVIVLEKSSSVGGNTIATQSGMNAVGTDVQEEAGFAYSEEEFIEMHTNDYANKELVEAFAENSADTVTWLESLGMEFTINAERNGYTHIDANGGTTALAVVDVLYSTLKESGATILFNTTATTLIEEDGTVTGVIAVDADGNELTFKSNAVVLATGGYGQNSELVYESNPSLTGAITDEIAPTTGDGLYMAGDLGAATVDLDKFTTFPIVEATTHQMIFPMILPKDSIFVNSEGNRFANEKFDGEETVAGTLAEGTVFVIFDQMRMDSVPTLQNLYSLGAVKEGVTVEELAENIGVNADNLKAAVDQWNTDFPTGVDSVFGRDTNMENDLSHAPYYAIEIGVGIHYCLGGLVINTDSQVMNTEGNVIEGLYAAGEVTGGLHGDVKVDGSTFADSLIFGRQSGIKSAAFALSKGTMDYVAPATKQEVTIQAEGNFTDGVYEGTGAGRGGDITVQVTVENSNITDITVVSSEETASIFEGVETNLIPAMIAGQTTDVDVISGATLSSNGVIEAVKNALAIQ